MKDENRTKEDLIKELRSLRRTVARLEKEKHEQGAADSFLGGILDSLDDPVFVKDEQHRWVILNEAACRLLGKKREQVVGRTDRELLPKRDAEAIARQDNEVLETGMSVFHAETFGPKKDQRILGTKKSLFIQPETGEKFIAGTIRDITRLRRATEELTETADRLRILFDYAPDAYYLNDLKGNFVDGNRAAEELIGFKKEELIGKSFLKLKLISPSQMPKAVKNLALSIRGKRTGPDEFTLRRPNGTTFTVEITTYPVKIKGQTLILGIARDISRRKANEEERHQLEEHLYQAEKMQALGQLAGGIAHDFNNQLGIIIGYAEILEESLAADTESVRFLERIFNAARRASGLTRQLLAYARKGHYQNVSINVHTIIKEVMELLEHTMDKRIRMNRTLVADPPLISGDPTQLQNAVLNVALNARDAMPEGGNLRFGTALVTLDKEYCDRQPYHVDPGRYLQITVEDTGTGMSKEVQKRIFEPFYTTKEKSRGTGMGMAAVYGTVKSHKGSIEIFSEPGKGTQVFLFFPVTAVKSAQGKDTADRRIEQTRSARILLVDDEAMIRTLGMEILQQMGHTVITAEDGVDALEVFKKQKDEVDLVLLDVVMPRMNGHDTLQELLKISPGIRVILCSGYSLDSRARESLRSGAKKFLQKPLSRNTLARAIDEVLRAG